MNTTHTKIDQLGDKVALIFLTGSPLLLAIKNNKEAQQQLSEGLIAFKSAVLEKRDREMMEKVVVYVSQSETYSDRSHEDRLKLKAEECEIHLADTAKGVWGDDWNDAPDYCNSGTPYENTMKGIVKIKITLGQPLQFVPSITHTDITNKPQ